MKEHPILFSGEMVKAILEGRKTQTRRVAKQAPYVYLNGNKVEPQPEIDTSSWIKLCPYGQVGDRLWIREAFKYIDFCLVDLDKPLQRVKVQYEVDLAEEWVKKAKDDTTKILIPDKWKPSIFMPRWASRITLEITGIRVERLQEITEEDAKAEGTTRPPYWSLIPRYRAWYEILWDSINGKKYPWSSNTWVWVLEFKKL